MRREAKITRTLHPNRGFTVTVEWDAPEGHQAETYPDQGAFYVERLAAEEMVAYLRSRLSSNGYHVTTHRAEDWTNGRRVR